MIAAPLRVLVPHVDVSMTASIPSCFTRSAISRPMRRVLESGLANPEVEMNSSWSLPITPSRSSSRIASRGTKRSGILPHELRIVATVGDFVIFGS